jgi:hypothetical protein
MGCSRYVITEPETALYVHSAGVAAAAHSACAGQHAHTARLLALPAGQQT